MDDNFEMMIDLMQDNYKFLDLKGGEEIKTNSRCTVIIKCTKVEPMTEIPEGYEDGGYEFLKKYYDLYFDADESPKLIVDVIVSPDPDGEPSSAFEAWWTDSDGNDSPSNSGYYDEFMEDLQPVED